MRPTNPNAPGPPRPPRFPGLRATILRRLLLLIASTVAPLVLLGGWVAMAGHEGVRAAVEERLLDGARALAEEVDREFERGETALAALAASSALRRGDLDAFEGEMRAVARVMGAQIGLATADGLQALNTIWEPGERRRGVEAPAFVRDVFPTGRAQHSDLFLGPSDGRPVVALAVPVFRPPAPGGAAPAAVSHALGFIVPRERFRDMLAKAANTAPDHWGGAVLDRAGRFVARSRGDRRAAGRQAGPDVLELLAGGGGAGGGVARGRKDLEGNPVVCAFARAPRSGFAVVASANEELLYAPLWGTVRSGAGVACAVLLGCFGWAVVGSRRVAAAFGRVPQRVAAAAAAAAAAPAAWPSTGLREADDLAAALAGALGERDRADAGFRAVFEASPVGMARVDMGGRVRDANEAFLRIVGADRGRLRAGAVRWDGITPPEFLHRDEAAIAEAVRHGRCAPYEKEYALPDGRRVPVLVAFALLDRARGEGAAFVVDLTEQKRAEAALEAGGARLAPFLAGAAAADAGGRRRAFQDGPPEAAPARAVQPAGVG